MSSVVAGGTRSTSHDAFRLLKYQKNFCLSIKIYSDVLGRAWSEVPDRKMQSCVSCLTFSFLSDKIISEAELMGVAREPIWVTPPPDVGSASDFLSDMEWGRLTYRRTGKSSWNVNV